MEVIIRLRFLFDVIFFRNVVALSLMSLCLVVVKPSMSAANSVLDTIGERLEDPLGLQEALAELSKILERTRLHADALLDKADANILNYISLIDNRVLQTQLFISSEIDTATADFGNLLTEKINEIHELEKAFISDTSALIQCATVKSAFEIKETISEILNDLGEREPAFHIGPFPVGSVRIKPKHFNEPVDAWERMVRSSESALSSVIAEDSITNITNIYDAIVRQSEDAKCFYPTDSFSFKRIYLVQLEYRRRSAVWARVLL
ncbi:MAG: hypothetical protein ACU0DI_07465 [Paracoccaceae bacterium]